MTRAFHDKVLANEANKAPLASPDLTGTPTAPTAEAATDTTQIATTEFVQQELASAGGLALIASTDASDDATIEFTGFNTSSYDGYLFQFEGVEPSTDAVQFRALFSTDGGTSFITTAGYYHWGCVAHRTSGTALTDDSGGDNSDALLGLTPATTSNSVVGNGSANETGVNGVLHLPKSAMTGVNTLYTSNLTFVSAYGSLVGVQGFGGVRSAQSNINAIRFYFSSGNIATGTISMFGIANS